MPKRTRRNFVFKYNWMDNFRVEVYYWYAVDSHGHARRRGRERTAGGSSIDMYNNDGGKKFMKQTGAQIQARRAGCRFMHRYRSHAFDGGIFRVVFFWDRLNVHTFNCHHRADRRVEGWLQRDGFKVVITF